jgi:hypothetical protein
VAHDRIFLFAFFCQTNALLFILRRHPWREDRSVICSAICQWSESWRIHNHALLSHLRLLGSLSIVSYDSQGLRWKYSNPPPHGDKLKSKSRLLYNWWSVSQSVSNRAPLWDLWPDITSCWNVRQQHSDRK